MIAKQQYKAPFFYSLFLHIVVLLILVASFEFSAHPLVTHNSDKKEIIISAMVLNEPLQPSKIIQNRPPPEIKSVAPMPPKPKPAVIPKQEIKTPVVALPDEAKKLKEEMIQKQLLADLKKQKEAKKQQKLKALQSEFEKEMKQVQAKALQQQMLQEQKRLANVRAQHMQGIVDKYKALILQSISQHWRIPPNANKKRFAELLIRLAPGGTVLDVQLTKTSGDDGIDRSARAAVFKASPLPVPTSADEFEAFRQFVLKVKPENIIASG